MIAAQVERARKEWQDSRRLRLVVLVILLAAGVHLALLASESRAPRIEEYRRDAVLVERLRDASAELGWPERAEEAEQKLAAVHEELPVVDSPGLAQAELQAWLTQQAQQTGLSEISVRVETTLEVGGHPDLWQVLARLDAAVPEGRLGPFLLSLSSGLPWIQAERLEVTTARAGQRLVLTARGYYRNAGESGVEETAIGSGL